VSLPENVMRKIVNMLRHVIVGGEIRYVIQITVINPGRPI